jgi:hypothetical protein
MRKGGKLAVDLVKMAKLAISPVLGKGLAELVRAERLLRELEPLMPRLEVMVRGEDLDPARSREPFRVAMTDHASMILLPSLTARVAIAHGPCKEGSDSRKAGSIRVANASL